MNFILDIGNTQVKGAVFQGDNLVFEKTVSLGDLGNLMDEIIEKKFPTRLISSSVSASEAEIEVLLDQRLPWVHFTNQISLPIKNEYHTPETLGTDRLAGVMGAFATFPNTNVLVIDAGTCITVDLITSDHRYFGGAISPGIQMRFKSLHHFTKNLPVVSAKGPLNLIGQNTEDAIRSGVINGAKMEVAGIIKAYEERFGKLKVILTGGDAFYFVNPAKNTIFADPNLVLKGLNNILNYHYQEN